MYFLVPSPFSPSPLCPNPPSSQVLLVSMSLFQFCLFINFVLEILYISEIVRYLSFSDWLISLSIYPLEIHNVANGKILFFFVAECPCDLLWPMNYRGKCIYVSTSSGASYLCHGRSILWVTCWSQSNERQGGVKSPQPTHTLYLKQVSSGNQLVKMQETVLV